MVPLPVAIGSSTVMLPAPSKIKLNDPVIALPVARSNTKIPASDCTSVSAVSVINPESTLTPAVLTIAPLETRPETMPEPPTEIGSGTVMPPVNESTAPLTTVVLPPVPPNAEPFVKVTVPELIAVDPVYVLVPESVNVPAPFFIRPPVLVAMA